MKKGATMLKDVKIGEELVLTTKKTEINQVLGYKKKIVVLESDDSSIYPYIPPEEYSIYHNSIKDFKPNKPLHVLCIRKFERDGITYIEFSAKKSRQKHLEKSYSKIEKKEPFLAEVISINEYSALLKAEGLHLTLMNSKLKTTFKHKAENLFKIGDIIPVVFDRYRKNKRVINVLPVVSIPLRPYEEKIKLEEIEEGQELVGIINKVGVLNIGVQIGMTEDEESIGMSLPYNFTYEAFYEVGQEVTFMVTKKHTNNQLSGVITGLITNRNEIIQLAYGTAITNYILNNEVN